MKAKPTELAPVDRQSLWALTMHPGFAVLKRLMEVRVQFATVQMLSVSPDDEKRATKIDALQAQAYARNAFCSELMQDIQQQIAEEESAQDEKNLPDEEGVNAIVVEALKRSGYLKPTENNNESRNNAGTPVPATAS